MKTFEYVLFSTANSALRAIESSCILVPEGNFLLLKSSSPSPSSSPGATGSPASGAISPPSSSTVIAEHVALSFGRSVSYPCAQFETFNQGGNGVSSFLKSTPTPSSTSSSTASPARTTSSSTTAPTAPAESDISDDLPMRLTVETVVHIAKQAGESLGISVAGGKSTNHAVLSPPSSAAGAVEGGRYKRNVPMTVPVLSVCI